MTIKDKHQLYRNDDTPIHKTVKMCIGCKYADENYCEDICMYQDEIIYCEIKKVRMK